MHVFYTPDITSDQYVLSEAESKHAVRVLRVNHGDEVLLTNGVGTLYTATILDPNPKRCSLSVIDKKFNHNKRSYHLHIAIAPTKNIDRFEWFLEKATEIGIDEITPILGFHSERKIIKEERLEKVIVAAMKQSIKAYKPVLNPLITLDDFLASQSGGKLCIAHCYDQGKVQLKDVCKTENNITVLIGPEGDFSLEEVEKSIKKGAVPVSLGESRLRTETAGLVACHTVNLLCSNP